MLFKNRIIKEVNNDNEVLNSIEDSNQQHTKSSLSDKIKFHFFRIWRKLRHDSAALCDKSFMVSFIDSIYYRILSMPIKTSGIFLFTFSIVSIIISIILNRSNLSVSYFLNADMFEKSAILITALILMTSGKNVGDLLSESRMLSNLSIVYSQNGILSANAVKSDSGSGYSTAFFVGILSAIMSFLHPSSYVVMLFLTIISIIFIINRPECGLLIILSILPFSSPSFIGIVSIITFIALIYKYIRCKRHISFDILFLLSTILVIYIYLKKSSTITNTHDYSAFIRYFTVIAVCITTINLVRSTSILSKFIKLILICARIYSVCILAYYILSISFGNAVIDLLISNSVFGGLLHAITNKHFIVSIIMLTGPICLATAIGSEKKREHVFSAVCISIFSFILLWFSDFWMLTIYILAIASVLTFFSKKYLILAIASPFISSFLVRISSFIPDMFKPEFVGEFFTGVDKPLLNALLEIFKHHWGFGIGIGENNVSLALNEYSNGMYSNISNINSLFVLIIITLGIFGIILFTSFISIMTVKVYKTIPYAASISKKAKFITVGLFVSSIFYCVSCIFTNCFSDIRTAVLFAITISLGYTSKRCFEADYI